MQRVRLDEKHCYVYGEIPENCAGQPAIGLIAHMDTVDAVPGRQFAPRAVLYKGGDICLNAEKQITLSPREFPELLRYTGKELIVTDGTTVLGADDKAGVAEIMDLCQRILADPATGEKPVPIILTCRALGRIMPIRWMAAASRRWSLKTSTPRLSASPSTGAISIPAPPRAV